MKIERISARELTDKGICPTCYNRTHNFCVFGDNSEQMIFENELFECFLCENPRANGHTIVLSKQHYKDMTEIPDELCKNVFVFTKQLMCAIKKVYSCESVYLCTMNDGPMNHFHLQLIPRYSFEERGSKNFVKPRFEYCEDKEKLNNLRLEVKNFKEVE